MNYLETVKKQPPRFTKSMKQIVEFFDIRSDYIDKHALQEIRSQVMRSEEVT